MEGTRRAPRARAVSALATSRVLFLDLDGVLVPFTRAEPVQAAVAHLNRIVATTGALGVISSSWREHMPLRDIARELEQAGVVAEVVGATPILLGGTRGDEIGAWLHKHGPVASFVILDDCPDVAPHRGRLVLTDSDVGLTAEDADRAISLLLNGSPAP